MKNAWLLAALVLASTAFAQADGGTRLGVGLFLSEPLLAVEAAASHVHWIDDQGRAILSLNNPNLTLLDGEAKPRWRAGRKRRPDVTPL